MKFVKIKNLYPYEYFGNFELINKIPLRNETMRIESEKCYLMKINKKQYADIINKSKKKERQNEVNNFHKSFYPLIQFYLIKILFLHLAFYQNF